MEVDGLRLPPGQERQLVGGTGGVQKLVQRQAAQLPQEVQLIVQCSLQDGRHFADSRLPDTDRLGFEDGSGKVFAEIGGVLEEGCFEGSGSVAHGSRALGAAAIRSVRSTNFAMTSSSSRARKMTSPWSRAFHSVRFIISLSII